MDNPTSHPRSRKYALALISTWLLLLPAAVQAQLTYYTNAGTITVSGYDGDLVNLVIPAMINGLPVTSIGDYAFSGCISLTNVTIPNSVTSIGDSAFSACSSLTSVTIPNSVTSIGIYAFYFCESLMSVTIPNSVTSIGDRTFSYCTSLTSVTIGNSVTSLGYFAFAYCYSLTSVTIPNSVTTIGDGAFYSCPSLTSVTIPNSVTSIGVSSFSECTGLTNVTIGNSVTDIGWGAFWGCTGLTSVTIPNSVTSIGSSAFYYCTSLTSVYFQGNAPFADGDLFTGINVIVYYLPGTTGWGPTFGGRPTVLWNPTVPTGHPTFGVQADTFGFTITGSSNLVIVVEAANDLSNPLWTPVSTNTLNTFVGANGTSYFSDPQWTNHPTRFYRLRSP